MTANAKRLAYFENWIDPVAAQMLEANPNLTPQQIKRLLMETAEMLPLPLSEFYRQGRGVVDPRRAVERAISIA